MTAMCVTINKSLLSRLPDLRQLRAGTAPRQERHDLGHPDADPQGEDPDPELILGTDFLRRYKVWISYARNRIFPTPAN